MANELGQTVGKPWEISEETEWDNFQANANSFQVNAGSFNYNHMDASDSTVAPGQVIIRASVRVSFQLE